MRPHTTHHDDCGCLSEKHRAEIDALRARVAGLETVISNRAVCAYCNQALRNDSEEFRQHYKGCPKHPLRLALAASQAEARELREALAMTWPGISGYSAPQSPLGALGGDIQRTHRAATAALSRPPGDDTALREVCRKVAMDIGHGVKGHDGHRGCCSTPEKHATFTAEVERIVNRILGQPGDDAAPTKEDQMPESREMTLTEKQVVDLAAVVFGKSVEKDPVIEDIFTYHAPEGDQAARYQLIREAAKQFAYTIHCLCEPGPDRTTAIRKVREAAMTANQSIATRNAQYR